MDENPYKSPEAVEPPKPRRYRGPEFAFWQWRASRRIFRSPLLLGAIAGFTVGTLFSPRQNRIDIHWLTFKFHVACIVIGFVIGLLIDWRNSRRKSARERQSCPPAAIPP